MASLIPGYEYDIFISYRQKDNKGDHWVSEFVEALKTELESTFKEEISVYFDENPHDGLLETHDVDASLKEKLKCLIFIPILSRTYCDPKSFAWEHEFKAFVEIASKDQYGMKVKLPNGNVASRVLPVQIHELDTEDKKCIDDELDGHIRSIEFIYREQGVDRPLKTEDREDKNLSGTKYNNQLNKVAHTVRSIVSGLKNPQINAVAQETKTQVKKKRLLKGRLLYVLSFGIIILLTGGLFYSLIHKNVILERSIAVLPFYNNSPGDSNRYFIDGVMEEILNNLQKVKDLRVLPRSSTDQYKENRPTISQIARKLNVNYIIEGSGKKYGDRFLINVRLIEAKKEKPLWSNSYKKQLQKTSDIIDVQGDIAKTIASELNVGLTSEEQQQIEKIPTQNLNALTYYQLGKAEEPNFNMFDTNNPSIKRATMFYRKALACDSLFAPAYVGLAYVNASRTVIKDYFSSNFLDDYLLLINKALSIDSTLTEAHFMKAGYYFTMGNPESTLDELNLCLHYNPHHGEAYGFIGDVYAYNPENLDFVKSIENYKKSISLEQGNERTNRVLNLAYILEYIGFPDSAINYCKTTLNTDLDSAKFLTGLNDSDEKETQAKKLLSNNPDDVDLNENLGLIYYERADYTNALKYFSKGTKFNLANKDPRSGIMSKIAYTYSITGNKKEATYWFKKQKSQSLSIVENKRFFADDEQRTYYILAAIYSFEEKRDSAYFYLRKLENMKVLSAMMIDGIKTDPMFNSLRREVEFHDLMARVEAKYKGEHDRVGRWMKEN